MVTAQVSWKMNRCLPNRCDRHLPQCLLHPSIPPLESQVLGDFYNANSRATHYLTKVDKGRFVMSMQQDLAILKQDSFISRCWNGEHPIDSEVKIKSSYNHEQACQLIKTATGRNSDFFVMEAQIFMCSLRRSISGHAVSKLPISVSQPNGLIRLSGIPGNADRIVVLYFHKGTPPQLLILYTLERALLTTGSPLRGSPSRTIL